MERTKKIILENKEKFPEFVEQLERIHEIENDFHDRPDHCIESVKSLAEGVVKNILIVVDINHEEDRLNKETNLRKLFKKLKQ